MAKKLLLCIQSVTQCGRGIGGNSVFRFYIALITSILCSVSVQGQTLTEKLLLESPRLSFNVGIDYNSNLQDTDTYQNRQSSTFIVSPRFRLNDTYTLVGFTGGSQSFTQETRSDMLNTAIGITRTPWAIGRIADLRPTLQLILPTNEVQRNDDSLRGAIQITGNAFIRTNTQFIVAVGTQARLNNHQYSISALNGANIQTLVTPYVTLGWQFTPKWQLVTQSAYTMARTYRGTNRNLFGLDQSLTYIPSRKLSFTVGHNNQGSMLSRDGSSSNFRLFDTRTSVFYVSALYNF